MFHKWKTEGEEREEIHSIVQLPSNIRRWPWNRYRSLVVVTRLRVKIIWAAETDRSNGSSSVRELDWEIKLMTFEYSNIHSYVEANNTHRWGRWTEMKREVRLQLGLGERWFNRAWKLLWQLWKLSFSRTTCNENVLRRHWSIPISNLIDREDKEFRQNGYCRNGLFEDQVSRAVNLTYLLTWTSWKARSFLRF